MDTKHTPGPWLKTGNTVYALDERGICNRFSVQVQGGHQNYGRGLYDAQRTSIAELEANARLIAAAPELLARLRDARDRLQDMLEGDDGQAWDEAEKALPLIDAAIAKATGQ